MPRHTKGRTNGEGSIYEYPEGSGHWFAQIKLDNGSYKRQRAHSQREAREMLRKLQAQHAQGIDLSAQQPTLAQWCTTWLETFAINLKPNIKEDYAGIIRRYIADEPIGKRKLNKLTPAECRPGLTC